jgi:hypothetical protein
VEGGGGGGIGVGTGLGSVMIDILTNVTSIGRFI